MPLNVWKTSQFLLWIINTLRRSSRQGGLSHRLQEAKITNLETSIAVHTLLAENHLGLPF